MLKKIIKSSALAVIVSSFGSPLALAQEPHIIQDERIVVWEGSPLHLEVPLGQERRIDFPEPIVELNIKPEEAQLSEFMLTPTGTLLWKPKAPYQQIRTRAISMTGAHYIVDFSSESGDSYGSTRTVKIVDPINSGLSQTPKSPQASIPPSSENRSAANQSAELPVDIPDFLVKNKRASNTPNFVEMSRFAMSHFTGSPRLIPKMNASEINSYNPPKKWIRIFGDRLNTKTLKSWKIGKFFVTAIMLQNKSQFSLEFDPRALRGSFLYSAMMNPLIQPKGTVGDESLLVVISSSPFQEASKE